jgi:hypothetical protein
MPGIRFASVAAVSAVMLGLGMSSAAAGTTSSARAVISGTAGADIAACLAHVPGAVSEDWYDVYTPGCTGHDEPELDPVSPAPRSAQNITWHVQLPADGAFPVSGVGPTFWFGGTVKDANPAKIGQEGFLELQFYPDSFASACTPDGGFSVVQAPDVYTACSPVWTIEQQGQQIDEPAAFNGMLTDARVKAPFVMHARDIVDVHIWAPRPDSPYREQLTDETSGRASSVLVLISPQDGPLTPEFSTQEIGNALDWGGVWDTPMVFVWEIGHSDLYGDHPEEFCVPGQTFCGSFNAGNWAGFRPIRIFGATFGDGSRPRHWAAVSDTGGKAEVLGNSFVGPTDCTAYGGPYCIYPWFSADGRAISFGVGSRDLGGVGQFAQTATCPAVSAFPGPTYCATIIR